MDMSENLDFPDLPVLFVGMLSTQFKLHKTIASQLIKRSTVIICSLGLMASALDSLNNTFHVLAASVSSEWQISSSPVVVSIIVEMIANCKKFNIF